MHEVPEPFEFDSQRDGNAHVHPVFRGVIADAMASVTKYPRHAHHNAAQAIAADLTTTGVTPPTPTGRAEGRTDAPAAFDAEAFLRDGSPSTYAVLIRMVPSPLDSVCAAIDAAYATGRADHAAMLLARMDEEEAANV